MKIVKFGKKKAFIALLSVVIPVGLLTGFRLTGILQEPLVPEVVQAGTIQWNMTRPTLNNEGAVPLDENVVSFYNDSVASIFFEINVGSYYEDYAESFFPFWGNDGVIIQLNANANIAHGFIHTIVFRFFQQECNATLEIWNDPDAMELRNVKLANSRDAWSIEETYAEFYGENQPQYCGVKAQVAWVFLDKNNRDQQIATTLEVTYFDGMAYRRADLPILIRVLTP